MIKTIMTIMVLILPTISFAGEQVQQFLNALKSNPAVEVIAPAGEDLYLVTLKKGQKIDKIEAAIHEFCSQHKSKVVKKGSIGGNFARPNLFVESRAYYRCGEMFEASGVVMSYLEEDGTRGENDGIVLTGKIGTFKMVDNKGKQK